MTDDSFIAVNKCATSTEATYWRERVNAAANKQSCAAGSL